MSKIVIGEDPQGKHIRLDVDLLIPSRLLIQANSGGGKSWLLRRLAEQLYGHVQTIIIDPEGEFFTLREKYGYVLVGENGETPCDLRSAAMLAERFLELKASAVCDLYEAFRSRPMDRRQWVRAFLNALIDAPRNLWHPLIVIVDEAHKFCPQESPKAASMIDREIISGCKEAMIALSTTGRKRGFCPIWATQRLAKVDKDASAEFFNRLVGMTIEDVDVDRAADLMSVSREEKQDFRQSLRTLSPGEFFAFGRAIAIERTLVKVGPVETHHPEGGKQASASTPPPMPDDVKRFLPQLSDLPKEAEEKVRTVADLEKKVRELTRELKQRPKAESAVKVEKVADEKAIKRAVDVATAPLLKQLEGLKRKVQAAVGSLRDVANLEVPKVSVVVPIAGPEPRRTVTAQPARPTPATTQLNGDLSGPEQKILDQLAELEALGIPQPEKPQLGLMAGYTNVRSGGFSEPMGRLVEIGYAQYPRPGYVALTDEGRSHARVVDTPLSTQELHERLYQKLGGPEAKLLRTVIEMYPEEISKEDLAQRLGYTNIRSGGFSEPIGRLRSLGIIEYPRQGTVKAVSWLWLDAESVRA